MKPFRFKHDTSAVSPIISAILLLTIMLITVGAIMAWAIPRLDQMEKDAQYDGAYSGIEVFDTRADDVIYGGEGTSRSMGLSIGGGDIFLGRDNGYIIIYWSLIEENLTVSGVDSKDGSFTFQFEELSAVGLRVNITGTGGTGFYVANESSGTINFPRGGDIGVFEPRFKFGDVQYIRIFNDTQDVGEIYYFRMKVIEYQLRTSDGYFEIKWMNGAIITNRGSSSGAVSGTPYIYPSGDALYMNIVDLSANRSSGFHSAGRGSYSVNVKNTGSELLATKDVYSVRMSIHTEYAGGWNGYFLRERGFERVKDGNYKDIGVGYNQGGITRLKLMRTELELTGVT